MYLMLFACDPLALWASDAAAVACLRCGMGLKRDTFLGRNLMEGTRGPIFERDAPSQTTIFSFVVRRGLHIPVPDRLGRICKTIVI
jgi:hypothetical protein